MAQCQNERLRGRVAPVIKPGEENLFALVDKSGNSRGPHDVSPYEVQPVMLQALANQARKTLAIDIPGLIEIADGCVEQVLHPGRRDVGVVPHQILGIVMPVGFVEYPILLLDVKQ